MRIKSITVRNYRVHRELTVDLDGSLTLVGGLNETGKSTLVEAAHRALFLRARVGGDIQRAMLSNGCHDAPEVEVRFEARGKSFCIKKRFSGNSGHAILSEENGQTWRQDEAEAKLAEILDVAGMATGRGASGQLSQQWGHLWVWQGQAGDDPVKHATEQKDSLLARLQEIGGGAAMLSDFDAMVAADVTRRQEATFTNNGSVRQQSDVGRALREAETAAAALGSANETLQKLQRTVTDSLEAEQFIDSGTSALATLRTELKTVSEKLAEVESLQNAVRTQSVLTEGAVAAHREFVEYHERIAALNSEITECSNSLAPRREHTSHLASQVSICEQQAVQADSVWREAVQTTRASRSRHDLVTAHATLLEKSAIRDRLLEKRDQVLHRKRLVEALETERAKLPAITASRLESIRSLENNCCAREAALQAMAAGIELLVSDQTVQAGCIRLEVGQPQILTEDTEVTVGPATRLRITPGGGTGLAEARRQAQVARDAFQQELGTLGIGSIAEAAAACAQRQQFDADIQAGKAELAGLGSETIDQDVSDAIQAYTAAEASFQSKTQLAGPWNPPTEELAVKAAVLAAAQELQDAEADESRCRVVSEQAAVDREQARESLSEHQQSLRADEMKLAELEIERNLLTDRHGDGPTRSGKLAQLLEKRTAAEGELNNLNGKLSQLQPDLLRSDHDRLGRAVERQQQQLNDAVARRDGARRFLESDGTADPQAAVALAEARDKSAREHHAIVERRAKAIQLLHTLMRKKQEALSESFTRPLAEKVSSYLRCMFGPDAQAAVILDGNAFSGLRLTRATQGTVSLPFDSLSAGAKEQVAAAFRLAMAEVLAPDYDNCLPVVFDDSFAYSDPARVVNLQRMLDHAARQGLQVIVLSCNPSDYAGLGAKLVALGSASQLSPPTGTPAPSAIADTEELQDEDDDPADSSETAVDDDQCAQLLTVLRNSGGTKGNISLREELGWSDATYTAVKKRLLAAGRIQSGRGRGGSVTLTPELP